MSIFDIFQNIYILITSIPIYVNFLAIDLILTWIKSGGALLEIEAWLLSSTSKSDDCYLNFTWQKEMQLNKYSFQKAPPKLRQPIWIGQFRMQISTILHHCSFLPSLHSKILSSWYQWEFTHFIKYYTYRMSL